MYHWYTIPAGISTKSTLYKEDTSIAQRDGQHLYLALKKSDTAVFTGSNYDRWIGHLDKAYEAYQDLVGFTPFNGAKIGIISVEQNPGGAAVEGNPNNWHQPEIHDQLVNCNDKDEWSITMLHEIGHDFDDAAWKWDEEFFANTKMYYVVENQNVLVYPYTAVQLETFYETDSYQSYDWCMANNQFHGDALTY